MGQFFSDLYAFSSAVGGYWFAIMAWVTFVTGDGGNWLGFKTWLDRQIPARPRRIIEVTIMLGLVFWSGFEAWQDEKARYDTAEMRRASSQIWLAKWQQRAIDSGYSPNKKTPIQSIAMPSKPTPNPSTHSQPDVQLSFVIPSETGLLLHNTSGKLATNIKYWDIAWNLDLPSHTDPLPSSTASFDYIRSHEYGGPQGIFSDPGIKQFIKQGDRLFGFVAVTCPDCFKTRGYLFYITWGTGGWYCELPNGKGINVPLVAKSLPQISANPEKFLGDCPLKERKNIVPWP
jgi:hypothetical protein